MKQRRNKRMPIMLTYDEFHEWQKKAKQHSYSNLSEYVRHVINSKHKKEQL